MGLGFLTVTFLDLPERKEKEKEKDLFFILQTLNNTGHSLLSILPHLWYFLFCKIYAEFLFTFTTLLHNVGDKVREMFP